MIDMKLDFTKTAPAFDLDFLEVLNRKKASFLYSAEYKAYKPANRTARRFLLSNRVQKLVKSKGFKLQFNAEFKDITVTQGDKK